MIPWHFPLHVHPKLPETVGKIEKFRVFQNEDSMKVEKGDMCRSILIERLHRPLETSCWIYFCISHCHSLREKPKRKFHLRKCLEK